MKNIELKNISEFISKNKKPFLIIGGSIAVVGIGIVLVKSAKSGISNFFNPGSKTVGGKFIEQQIDETKLKISKEVAKNYAEQLFEAFNYRYGTDKKIIDSIFSKINSEDFKLIYNNFGKRSYSSLNTGSPSDKWYALDTYIGSKDVDLMQWLNSELDVFDFALKAKIRKVVEPLGFII